MTWILTNEPATKGARWVNEIYEDRSWDAARPEGIGGRLWINPDSGDQIAMIADGGWAMATKSLRPHRSRFRVFRYSQTSGSIVEISPAFLTTDEGYFDEEKIGNERYADLAVKITEKISRSLEAVKSDGSPAFDD